MSAGRDWISTAAAVSDKASDTPVPEATEVSTSTCKHRKKDVTLYKLLYEISYDLFLKLKKTTKRFF